MTLSVTKPPQSPRNYVLFALGCALLGVVLRWPSMTSGFSADDYAQLAMLDGTYPVKRQPWDLYNFSDGSKREADILRHAGFFPWFTHPEVRLSMFRPLSSLLIALDHHLFGNDAFRFHVHSVLWWLGMLFAVAWLLGALLPRSVASLALLFFTVDESHTVPFAWIANRCSLGATLFGALALLAYVRYRERGSLLAASGCFAAFAFALAFGEYGLCFAPYVGVYELWRFVRARRAGEHAGMRLIAALQRHALALWPAVVPCVIFLAIRHALGRGPLHSGVYVGPDGDPAGFAVLIAKRVPVLFADLFAAIPSENWNFGNILLNPMYQRGWVSARWLWTAGPWRQAHSAAGGVTMLLGAVVWWLVARKLAREAERDPAHARHEPMTHLPWLFWGGMASLLTVVGSFPSSRLVIIAEIGMSALLAAAVVLCFRDLRERFAVARVRTSFTALAGAIVLAFHIIMPARFTHADSISVKLGSISARKAILTMEADKRRLPLQRLIVISALEYGTSIYIPLVLARHGRKPPRSCWTVSLAPGPHVLLRDSPNSFRIAPSDGYAMLANAPEELFADPNIPFKKGEVVDLGGMKITVLETAGPHIQEIRVETDVPFEDPSLHIVTPVITGIRRFVMPPIGKAVRLPPPLVPPL